MPAAIEERELTRNQRGLVDTCFEERQYEAAIALLDQLRAPAFAPPPDHIRQLLYMALFPPGDHPGPQEQAPSPVKGSPTKQRPVLSKTSHSPSAPESESALRVLFSFLATNSPASLFRALPRYPSHDLAGVDFPPGAGDSVYNEDSLIAREALCIGRCRDCWALLKEGFILRKTLLPKAAAKKRGRGAVCDDVHDAVLDPGHGTPAVVADHAWAILQWLLCLFEKDEALSSQVSAGKFSSFLLSQIPPPRGGAGPRWDAGSALDIVFHSIGQEDSERRKMAAQLLTLLIHLDMSESFDGLMFATALTTRLHTSSAQTVQNLMESLPKTAPVLTFKLTVCQKFLSSAPSVTGGAKPRPRPLPKRGRQPDTDSMSSLADIDNGRTGSNAPPQPVPTTCAEVFQLLASDHTSPNPGTAPPVLTIKYILLVSYAHLQGLLPPAERDSEWQGALSNGVLNRVIDIAFPRDSTYHTALTIITEFWPTG